MVANAIVPYSNNSIVRPSVPTKDEIEALWMIAERVCRSGLSKHKTPQDAFFVMGYGLELGIPQMTALRTIYSVQGGAPSCSGEAMLALIRKSGKAEIKLPSMDDLTDKATVWMKRRDSGEEFTASFSMKDAEKAGLVKAGGNWAKYPKNMLLWRCVSMCARFLFSDVIGGLYTLEEIAPNTPVDEQGAPIGEIIVEMPESELKVVKSEPEAIEAEIVEDEPLVDQPQPAPVEDAPILTEADLIAALDDIEHKITTTPGGHARVAIKNKLQKGDAIESVSAKGIKVIDNAIAANWFDTDLKLHVTP